MANNKLTITGIDELRQLPRELGAAAQPIQARAAAHARDRVRAAYPRVTGRLQDGVIVDPGTTGDPAVVVYTVKSTAPHAAPFEFGSEANNTRPRPTFLPITNAERRDATREVIGMVRAAGFIVSGDQD